MCRKGIAYKEIRSSNPKGEFPYICANPKAEVRCEYYELETQAEIDKVTETLAAFAKKVDAFWVRETEICPHCDETVSEAEQIGRCVYARPCGCRVGQGRLHENWKSQPNRAEGIE